jgi:hypothetical protein
MLAWVEPPKEMRENIIGGTTMGRLADKNILITGGNSRIGRPRRGNLTERARASPSAA